MNTRTTLAAQIAMVDATIKAKTAELAKLKAELIAEVGDAGDTIETAIATITVTRQTEDRNTGQVVYGFDLNTFLTQDERVQANLVKQGIVTKAQKVTKGQSPTVKVKAK